MFNQAKGKFTPRKPLAEGERPSNCRRKYGKSGGTVRPVGVQKMTTHEIKVAASTVDGGIRYFTRKLEVYTQENYEDLCKTPALKPDGHGGYFIILHQDYICSNCSNMGYVFRTINAFAETKHPDYKPGTIYKILEKGCRICGYHTERNTERE